MILFVYFLVSEFIPDFFALDYSFMMTLIIKDDTNKSEENLVRIELIIFFIICLLKIFQLDQEAQTNKYKRFSITSTDDLKESLVKTARFSQFKRNKNDFMITASQFNVLESIYSRSNGLGNIYKANYNSHEVTVRQLKFDRLSRYDLEGLSNDMEELM